MVISYLRKTYAEEADLYAEMAPQPLFNYVIRHVLLVGVVLLGCIIAQRIFPLIFSFIYVGLSQVERVYNATLSTRPSFASFMTSKIVFTLRMATYRAFVVYLWMDPHPATDFPAMCMLIAGVLFSLNRGAGLSSSAVIQSVGDSFMFLFFAASFIFDTPSDPYIVLSGISALAVMIYHLVVLKETHDANQASIEMERRIRQSQKMEAVGRLTGGVAHDFNNILTVIMGNLDLYKEEPDPAEQRALIEHARDAALRASVLTSQLLAFSRQSPLRTEAVDIAELLNRFHKLAIRVLPADIAIKINCPPGILPAHTDPNQLENALLNLVINARDAMAKGGTLTVSAETIWLEQNNPVTEKQGSYISISVTDTGTGIHRDALLKVTEPFFTTKGVGKGSGLGLSMVKGFSEQSGGGLTLSSQPNEGTTATIVLPAHRPKGAS